MTRVTMLAEIIGLVRCAATLSEGDDKRAVKVLENFLRPYPDAALLFVITQLKCLNKKLGEAK